MPFKVLERTKKMMAWLTPIKWIKDLIAEDKDKVMLLALIQILALGSFAWIDAGTEIAPGYESVEWMATVKAIVWISALFVALIASVGLVRLGFRMLSSEIQQPQEPANQESMRPQEAQDMSSGGNLSDHTDRHLYNRFLSFLGVLMAILVLDVAVVIGGLIKQGYLTVPLSLSTDRVGGRGLILIISCGLAVLGSVFFTANSLHRKQSREEFNVDQFWSGFWFRLGESVLFALVLFLIIIARLEEPDKWLALLIPTALLIGMFVKTGERLIFGMAERIFAMMKGILPVSDAAITPKPGQPRNLAVTKQTDQLILEWEEPISRAPVDSYRIYKDEEPSHFAETHATVRRLEVEAGASTKIKVAAFNQSGEGKPIFTAVP